MLTVGGQVAGIGAEWVVTSKWGLGSEVKRALIGIDGGASKTVCALADDSGALLARGVSGSANFFKNGLEAASQSLRVAIDQALAEVGLRRSQVVAACAGLAGVTRPEDRAVMERALAGILPDSRVVVENDGLVALAGATGGRPGVIVISGTGSIALGVNSKGERAQAGGWGNLLGDEGSGYDIARRAMIAAMRDFDGRGPATGLRQALIQDLCLNEIIEIVPLLYGDQLTHASVAALYPLVMHAAEGGDAVARGLIEEAARKLAEMAAAVLVRLHEPASTPLAVAGGVLTHATRLRELFQLETRRLVPEVRFVEARHPPEIGAVLIAKAAARGKPAFQA